MPTNPTTAITNWMETCWPEDPTDWAGAALEALRRSGYVLVPHDLLAEFVDDDECHFDHHGHCQTHGALTGQVCHVAQARELLRDVREVLYAK